MSKQQIVALVVVAAVALLVLKRKSSATAAPMVPVALGDAPGTDQTQPQLPFVILY
jgi:hypothetical protein